MRPQKREQGKTGMGLRFLEERREWGLPGLLYTDDLVLCGESEQDLKVMVARFVEVCGRCLPRERWIYSVNNCLKKKEC